MTTDLACIIVSTHILEKKQLHNNINKHRIKNTESASTVLTLLMHFQYFFISLFTKKGAANVT